MSKNTLKMKNVIEPGKLYKVLVKFSYIEKDKFNDLERVCVVGPGLVVGEVLKSMWENRYVVSLKMSDVIQEVQG